MNRLPVADKKITLILDYCKSNKDQAHTVRDVGNYLWANYSYPQFKTFNQLLGEIGEKFNVHLAGNDGEILQIVRYNTRPATYQWFDPYENTPLANHQTSFDFEEEPKCLQTPAQEEVTTTDVIEEDVSEEQSLLMEDVKAASKINFYDIDLLRQYLKAAPNKHEAIKEIMQVLLENI